MSPPAHRWVPLIMKHVVATETSRIFCAQCHGWRPNCQNGLGGRSNFCPIYILLAPPFGNLFVVPLVLDLAEKPTDSSCNSGCASPCLCEEMTLGLTFQIGGSPIDSPAKLASRFAKLDALRLLPQKMAPNLRSFSASGPRVASAERPSPQDPVQALTSNVLQRIMFCEALQRMMSCNRRCPCGKYNGLVMGPKSDFL